MSLRKDRFAWIVLAGWLLAVLSSPLILWAYPLFALIYFGLLLFSVIVMIAVNRKFIAKVKQRPIRVMLQFALLATPILSNLSIEKYRLAFKNPSRFQIRVYGDDKPLRMVVWKSPKEQPAEMESGKRKKANVYQSGLCRDQSWFFIPGIALRQNYEKAGHLMLAGDVVTEVEHDTINFRQFEKRSGSLYHFDLGDSYYNKVRCLGNTYDTILVRGKLIQFTLLKIVPEKDTGCYRPYDDYRLNCTNTGEFQIGNSKSLGVLRERIKQMLDSAFKH